MMRSKLIKHGIRLVKDCNVVIGSRDLSVRVDIEVGINVSHWLSF